jgi:hypothetical protein
MTWDAAPRLLPVGSVPLESQPSLLWIDGNAVGEHPAPVDGPPAGVTVRILRRDLLTGETAIIVNIPPGAEETCAEHHACVAESFKRTGDIWLRENHRPRVPEAGGYVFRPPQIKHGPMRTLRGTSLLIRFSATVVSYDGPIRSRGLPSSAARSGLR